MSEALTYGLVCFGSLFSIIDPFAAVPIFLALLGERTREEQRSAALRATLTCFIVLVMFGAAGSVILHFFSITLPAFKIAGGIILFVVGFEMLRARQSSTRSTSEERSEAQAKEDVAIIPLGLPLLAGPGAIATVMVLAGKARTLPHRSAVFISVMIVCVLSFAVLRSATYFARVLGRTGINVIGRVMGLILTATAVQFILDGAREAFPRLFA
jgi:multiple antibiotic resistance protein